MTSYLADQNHDKEVIRQWRFFYIGPKFLIVLRSGLCMPYLSVQRITH